MANPGNTGHKGYKMAKVTAITPQGEVVLLSLSCGHTKRVYPFSGYTPEQYAQHLQEPPGAFIIEETRIKCDEKHEA